MKSVAVANDSPFRDATLKGFRRKAHPMAMLSSMVNAAGCYYPELLAPQEGQDFGNETAFLISQVRTIVTAAGYSLTYKIADRD
jgi:citrate synthase